jgi:UDP-glucose 4-epimerase
MARKRVILVTGVGGYWGSRVAADLLAHPNVHVIGVDDQPPKTPMRGLDFIQADLRSTLLAALLRDEAVDTVAHLGFVENDRPSEWSFDYNVMGTMQVLSACAEAGVRHAVLKASTQVYGARADNSAYLREDHALRGGRGYGYLRDLIEIENFCHGFLAQAPRVGLTLLRFAHIVGPRADTPLTRLLREEATPVLLGFDPLMQIIHEADVVGALVAALLKPVPGVFNVASEGVMPLWRLLGLAGKTPLPMLHPLAYMAASVLGHKYAPLDLDYLRYPCVGDLRKMRTVLKFVPRLAADETLREFAGEQRLRQYVPAAGTRAAEDERLRETLARRARAKARKTAAQRVRAPRAPAADQPKAAWPSDYENGNGAHVSEELNGHG